MPLHLHISLQCMYFAFLAIGLLFFRKGQHGIAWFMTLAPFLAGSVVLFAFDAELLRSLVPLESDLYSGMSVVSAVLAAGALLLYGCSLGSHRARIPMWHQKADSPSAIVTWGVYGYVRHPFYSSYLLLMPASVLAAPTLPMLLVAVYCAVMLNITAATEERELLRLFGSEYADMMDRTGRFFPRIFGVRRSPAEMA